MKNYIKKAIESMKNTTIGYSKFNYSVIYGIFGIVLIILKQIPTIFNTQSTLVSNIYHVYSLLFLSFILLACLLFIYHKKLSGENKFARIFLKLFPYIFLCLGLMMVTTYQVHINKILSFVVVLFILSWIKIYEGLERVIIFMLAAISYILLSYFAFGHSDIFILDVTISLIISILAFTSSTIISQLFYSHQGVIKNLDLKNKNFEEAIRNLKDTHASLKISKKITDNMYELTQEVLKNENLDAVIQMVLDKAALLIPNSQAGSILIMNDGIMKFVAANGYDLENLKKIKLKFEETYQYRLENLYEPYIIKNLEVFDNEVMGEKKTNRLKKEAVVIAKSCLTCSFKHNGEFFGSINVDNFDSEDVFTDNDKYLIKQLAQEIEIIISIHQLYEKALKPTKYDDLTQAKTRRYCMNLLERTLKEKQSKKISICTVDINLLKKINDTYGHDVGDRFLFEFAEGVRKANIKENIFGRVGGDEFLIIFDDTDGSEAEKQIMKIKDYLNKHKFEIENKKILISFAHGVSVYGVDSTNISVLIKLSDSRMYEEKSKQKKKQKKIENIK